MADSPETSKQQQKPTDELRFPCINGGVPFKQGLIQSLNKKLLNTNDNMKKNNYFHILLFHSAAPIL